MRDLRREDEREEDATNRTPYQSALHQLVDPLLPVSVYPTGILNVTSVANSAFTPL